ncbi:NEW3 domain-containing protein [Pseudalkalibacillus salsuginis]|uniref:NEW3 domain-containing protein n=1 Tax=Pseudalkalibacillus salsuginis TaxID=2910972 RepID=UPI001F1AF13D|nr:NEW3 domain-containing protein [Pseudalkalibacillus salsuginis]MCF6410074.1 NEW3 domain-containing protein [Pseudalkalibacillus salsuginis]
MFQRKWMIALSLLMVLTLIIPAVSNGQTPQEQHDKELWSAVKPLDTITSFLNTGAHPDDEPSHLLAYLSRGLGVHTASMIANRGEGGQNEIGEELGNGLGIIRSREMIEASKVTGVEVFHLSETTDDEIYDFGFSKSAEETLQKWGEEETYERFIRLIRSYQPDIVMPSFRDVESQHGHHRAITILSLKAFEDAADPTVFPDQIEKEGLDTWQIKKLYLPAESEDTATVGIEVGGYDPVYDQTYPQIGEESRYLHKSQGMGREVEPGSEMVYLDLVKSSVGDIPAHEETLFQGLYYDFNEYAAELKRSDRKIKHHLETLQEELEEVIEAYPSYSAVLKETHDALKQLHRTKRSVTHYNFKDVDKNDLLHRLNVKEEQLANASKVASQLEVSTILDAPNLTQGSSTSVSITLKNNGDESLKNVTAQLKVPEEWEVKGSMEVKHLAPGEEKDLEVTVEVPEDAAYYQPYEDSALSTEVSYEVGKEPVQLHYDPEETIAVLPEVGLKAEPDSLIVNTAKEMKEETIEVTVTNYSNEPVTADVSLALPEGWEPLDSQSVEFGEDEKVKKVSFSVTPPEGIKKGKLEIQPVASVEGKQINTTVQEITYDHIGTFYYLREAAVDGVAFDLNYPEDLKIGYIESGFDVVADHLINAGMDVTKISEGELANEDLSQYDTIVTGIRAYLSREDLSNNNERLLDYVESGGHLVVQYNKPWDNWNAESTAPYPLTIGQPSIEWRVTDENSEYQILQPNHTLLNYPNNITDEDWEGWVQERGLYYPMEWDDRYEPLVNMTDLDGDTFDGGILFTDYGEGSYVYTNLVWYRQIQNQVPGGYRIFTNLLSYPKSE